MMHAGIATLMTGGPEKISEEMLVAIGDSLSDVASSNDGENGEDEDDEERAQGKLSEDENPAG
jgi:hypothetical protein